LKVVTTSNFIYTINDNFYCTDSTRCMVGGPGTLKIDKVSGGIAADLLSTNGVTSVSLTTPDDTSNAQMDINIPQI